MLASQGKDTERTHTWVAILRPFIPGRRPTQRGQAWCGGLSLFDCDLRPTRQRPATLISGCWVRSVQIGLKWDAPERV